MSLKTSTKLSSTSDRTLEQKAARDSRKAAKAAFTSIPHAESSSQARRSFPDPPTQKRRRDSDDLEELEVDLAAPEPLSKAEIRAARKKAKKGDGDADEISAKGADLAAASEKEGGEGVTSVKREKKRNSVWVGNLSFKTTPELLKEFVQRGIGESGGEAEGCVTRVNLPKKPGHGEFTGNRGSVAASW